MSLTKSTVRALAASVAIIAVGATVAGAAVFQLPILGFGHADVASANVGSTVRVPAHAVAKKVRPRVIVKTKYVDDIVHRPAPTPTYSAPAVTATATSWVAPAPMVAAAPAPTVAPTTTAPAVRPPSIPATYHDDRGAHETEHEGPPPSAGSTPSSSVPVEDR